MAFQKGHKIWLGKKHSEATKKKMSLKLIGNKRWSDKKHSEETKKKMSEAAMGHKHGFQKGHKIRLGEKHTEETKRKMSEARKGKKFSEAIKKKMSKAFIGNKKWLGKKHSEATKEKIGLIHKGKKLSDITKKKISLARIGEFCKENSGNWQGGKSFEPYGLEFNNNLREVIRIRDKRKYQICEKTELEERKRLCVHHIDYNKRNNDPKNLISLCRKCHSKTNKNRKYWTNYFQKKLWKN